MKFHEHFKDKFDQKLINFVSKNKVIHLFKKLN
jgi:hypothetical protein